MKRYKKVFTLFLLLLMALSGVILNIAILHGDEYANMAVMQRTVGNRGYRTPITDRNMIPFTHGNPRHGKYSIARHIIGYTDSSGKGVSGIEESMNSHIISSASPSPLKDGRGDDIAVSRAGGSSQADKHIKLTLDYHIQQIAENVLDKADVVGGIVIMDTESSDILAAVSRPQFDHDSIADHILSGGTELINRTAAAYSAGELYNIIVLAAQLEENNTDTDTLLRYADSFGLGNSVTKGIISESKGCTDTISTDTASCTATPLQTAQVMCILASGGIRREVNLISGVASADGTLIENMRDSRMERIISESTAEEILDTLWSNETGSVISSFSMYAGIFPTDVPRYAISVICENYMPHKIALDIQDEIMSIVD